MVESVQYPIDLPVLPVFEFHHAELDYLIGTGRHASGFSVENDACKWIGGVRQWQTGLAEQGDEARDSRPLVSRKAARLFKMASATRLIGWINRGNFELISTGN